MVILIATSFLDGLEMDTTWTSKIPRHLYMHPIILQGVNCQIMSKEALLKREMRIEN
jgi:anaerobic C4-dicarboxylate transporter